MKITVCGWYFDDNFYASLWKVKEKYPVFIVAHRDGDELKTFDLPYVVTENIGLEWGAYNHFLMNIWDGNDSILFMHDDIRFNPVVKNYEIMPGELVFNYLAEINFDHSYIFQNRKEEILNYGQHGRVVLISERLLHLVKKERGFAYDKENQGYLGNGEKSEKTKYHNYGINRVTEKLKEIQERRPGWKLLQKVYAPNMDMGYRGKYGAPKMAMLDALGMKI